MKRLLLVLLVIAALSAGVFASASQLGVNGGAIQAGSAGVTCDQTGVAVDAWGLNTLNNGYEGVSYVTIKGVDAACAGARLFARVKAGDEYFYSNGTGNDTGAPVSGYTWVTVDASGPTKTYQLWLTPSQGGGNGGLIDPAKISEVKIWLEGPVQ